MFADVLKALEMLLNAVKGVSAPEIKRRKIARRLLRIYLNLQDVIDHGRQILSLIKEENKLVTEVALSLLKTQQSALDELEKSLRACLKSPSLA